VTLRNSRMMRPMDESGVVIELIFMVRPASYCQQFHRTAGEYWQFGCDRSPGKPGELFEKLFRG
jgi:hypothetical protein